MVREGESEKGREKVKLEKEKGRKRRRGEGWEKGGRGLMGFYSMGYIGSNKPKNFGGVGAVVAVLLPWAVLVETWVESVQNE